jgi:hypothetical protein
MVAASWEELAMVAAGWVENLAMAVAGLMEMVGLWEVLEMVATSWEEGLGKVVVVAESSVAAVQKSAMEAQKSELVEAHSHLSDRQTGKIVGHCFAAARNNW